MSNSFRNIIVKHMNRNEITGDVEGFTPVASVNAYWWTTDDKKALEFAYQLTQNIFGSWSKNKTFENGLVNEDYNPNCTRLANLHEGGMGLRSTMVGDRIEIDGVEWEVAMVGFKEVA